jgi:hypothetical protein
MTDGQSVCLGIKHPSGAYDQIFINVRQLRVELIAPTVLVIISRQVPHRKHRSYVRLCCERYLATAAVYRIIALQWVYTPQHQTNQNELSYVPHSVTRQLRVLRGQR